MKIERKLIFEVIYKNRFLILSCAVLIAGTIFGTSMLNYLPEEICKNLYAFISQDAKSFSAGFFNIFCFPFIMLLGIYLAGFSAFGYITSFIVIFINGVFFGFENGINYMFSGTDYIINGLISYFTATLYFGFMLVIMAGNSVFSSRRILSRIKNKDAEIPHYNAKNQTVKFIAFTVIFAVFSAISAYISMIIQSDF
ncbi:MAG: hypothetical protein IJ306_10965 [Oscillospiraceae bacterium]|nr:hypothetical protein [Oscillospiraceae bacterium]